MEDDIYQSACSTLSNLNTCNSYEVANSTRYSTSNMDKVKNASGGSSANKYNSNNNDYSNTINTLSESCDVQLPLTSQLSNLFSAIDSSDEINFDGVMINNNNNSRNYNNNISKLDDINTVIIHCGSLCHSPDIFLSGKQSTEQSPTYSFTNNNDDRNYIDKDGAMKISNNNVNEVANTKSENDVNANDKSVDVTDETIQELIDEVRETIVHDLMVEEHSSNEIYNNNCNNSEASENSSCYCVTNTYAFTYCNADQSRECLEQKEQMEQEEQQQNYYYEFIKHSHHEEEREIKETEKCELEEEEEEEDLGDFVVHGEQEDDLAFPAIAPITAPITSFLNEPNSAPFTYLKVANKAHSFTTSVSTSMPSQLLPMSSFLPSQMTAIGSSFSEPTLLSGDVDALLPPPPPPPPLYSSTNNVSDILLPPPPPPPPPSHSGKTITTSKRNNKQSKTTNEVAASLCETSPVMQYTSCTEYNNTSPLLSAIPMPGMSSALDTYAYDNHCTNLIISNGDDDGGINDTHGNPDLLLTAQSYTLHHLHSLSELPPPPLPPPPPPPLPSSPELTHHSVNTHYHIHGSNKPSHKPPPPSFTEALASVTTPSMAPTNVIHSEQISPLHSFYSQPPPPPPPPPPSSCSIVRDTNGLYHNALHTNYDGNVYDNSDKRERSNSIGNNIDPGNHETCPPYSTSATIITSTSTNAVTNTTPTMTTKTTTHHTSALTQKDVILLRNDNGVFLLQAIHKPTPPYTPQIALGTPVSYVTPPMTPLPRYALTPPIDSLHTMGINSNTANSNIHHNNHPHHRNNRKNGHNNTYHHHPLPHDSTTNTKNYQNNDITSDENMNDIAILSETFLGSSVAQINKREGGKEKTNQVTESDTHILCNNVDNRNDDRNEVNTLKGEGQMSDNTKEIFATETRTSTARTRNRSISSSPALFDPTENNNNMKSDNVNSRDNTSNSNKNKYKNTKISSSSNNKNSARKHIPTCGSVGSDLATNVNIISPFLTSESAVEAAALGATNGNPYTRALSSLRNTPIFGAALPPPPPPPPPPPYNINEGNYSN